MESRKDPHLETHGPLDVEVLLEGLQRRASDRAKRETDRLRAEGLEPAERHDDWIHAGPTVFAVGVRPSAPGRLQFTVSAHGREGGEDRVVLVGAYWPRHPAEADADAFLDALTDAWPALAAPYLSDGAHWPETLSLRLPGVPPVEVSRVDGWLELASPGGRVALRSESVLAVETLRTIGDEIVRERLVSPEAASRWNAASGATDLPSYPREDWSETPPASFAPIERAVDAWFASKFGMTIEEWRLSAGLTEARHLLHWKSGRGREQTVEDWDPSRRIDVPEEEALAVVDEAAVLDGSTRETFLDKAAHERSMMARGVAIFGRDKARRDRLVAAGPATGGPSS